jgi:hypothetical protein
MATTQNIIHSSSFNFEYGTKAAAKRGNELIESIFVSHILPELEKAVSKKIPSEVRIELSKLEINIGTIAEKELSVNLAARIRESLEKALTFNFGQDLNGKSIAPDGQKLDNFLIQSLEIFLLKGYFPFAMEKSLTFDELVKRILQRNQDGLSEVLFRLRNREQAIQRIVNNLGNETFDELLTAQDPVNNKWIFEFRKFLLNLKKELNLNQLNDLEFIKMMNGFILNFTLNETSLTFSKEKFSANVLNWFIELFNPDITLIAEAINGNKETGPVYEIVEKSLKQLQDGTSKFANATENQPLKVEQLVNLLNTGGENLNSWNLDFLKKEILLAIQNQEKRKQLIRQLNQTGASFLFLLFISEKNKTLYQLIDSFTKNFAGKFNQEFSGETGKQVNNFVFETILYLHENAARKLENEEFILFLIYSAGLDLSKIKSSSVFQDFIQSEKSIRPENMLRALDNETQFPEISNIQKILSKNGEKSNPDLNVLKPDPLVLAEYSKVYKRKIIQYFLVKGFLPEAFNRFNLREVQLIFLELIQQRDDFLASAISKNEDPKNLFARLKSLIPITAPDDLEEYFIYFFREEYAGLSKILEEITHQFDFKNSGRSNKKSVKNEIFMQAMAESGGKNLPSVFRLTALGFLFDEFAEDSRNPENLSRLFETEWDKTRIKNALEQNLGLLLKRLRFSETGIQFSQNELKSVTQRIVFYARLNPQLFRDSVQKYTGEQKQIFTALKFYLSENQWEIVGETLSPLAGFKQFQRKPDVNEYSFENKKIEQYWTALSSFSPGTFSGKLKPEFWRSLVAGFGILVFAEEKKLTSTTFAKSFVSHLLHKLKAINEPELIYPVIGKMQDSGSKELRELVELWKDSDEYKTGQNEKNETEKQHHFKELEHHFGILEFYAKHGFLPWWAGQLSFPEVINKLHTLAGEISDEFEEMFFQAEKESQILKKLANRIPESAWFEIDRLITGNRELKAKWGEYLQNKKNRLKVTVESDKKPEKPIHQHDSIGIEDFAEKASENKELFFKVLYNFTDDQILNQWLKESHEIKGQIKSYLQLAPWFYFKNITPTQWRETVYEFSLNFYKEDLKRSKNQFHAEFLTFLKRQYAQVNWDEVLKSVYYLIQQPELKQKVVFPSELVRLLNLKPGLPDHIKELNKKMETIFSDEDAGIGVKVYNAGLILFWPFLTRLFEHLSFVKNGKFVNSELKNRAVYILQYLVFNETEFPEYELVLNKILVGMPHEDHLDPFITLTEEEKNMTNSLLFGLMNNWEKVKNSTPEGVQETFLKREGILRFKQEEVYLEVEKKGVDVLVKSIPWNISLIKLPWMKKTVHVEWV